MLRQKIMLVMASIALVLVTIKIVFWLDIPFLNVAIEILFLILVLMVVKTPTYVRSTHLVTIMKISSDFGFEAQSVVAEYSTSNTVP